MSLDFSYEKKARKFIIGVDEVGVGPLAGPVTACAVTGPAKFLNLRDSKQLTPRQREEFFRLFKENPKIEWAVAIVTPEVIDRINIFEARRLAAKRAVLKLEKILQREADLLLLDGRNILKLKRRQRAIIKGDEKIPLIAIASIIAKVTRDRAMLRCHKKYPEYRFDLHKGYGTRLHYAMLAKHGPCAIHRRSFRLFA